MKMLIPILIIAVIALAICLFLSYKKRRQEDISHQKMRAAMRESMDERASEFERRESEYTEFYNGVMEKEEAEREVAKRRRISNKDRAAVKERDNHTCQICGISKGFVDSLCPGLGDYLLLETDHIVSVKQGGSGDDVSNLQTLCWRCNRKKGGKKTNEDVKNSIDYGIHLLLPKHRTSDPIKELPRSEQLRARVFGSTDEVAMFMVSEFGMNEQSASILAGKAEQSGVSEEYRVQLAVNIFCKLLDENKI